MRQVEMAQENQAGQRRVGKDDEKSMKQSGEWKVEREKGEWKAEVKRGWGVGKGWRGLEWRGSRAGGEEGGDVGRNGEG